MTLKINRRRAFTDFNKKHIRNALFMAGAFAVHSPVKKGRHCAIVLDENLKRVAVFYNTYVDRCNYRKGTIHAEVGAISKIPPHVDRSKCTLVVVRSNFNAEKKMSKPCENCEKHIQASGIRHCLYSTTEGLFESINI